MGDEPDPPAGGTAAGPPAGRPAVGHDARTAVGHDARTAVGHDARTAERSFASVLAARRMCRDFLADPIAPEALDRVLAAALRGPAAGNTSALDLVVLEGGETRRYWDVTLPPGRREGFRWPGLLLAPVLVLPYVEPGAYLRRYAEADKRHAGLGAAEDAWAVPYWYVDGGAAVMAMLLAAEAEGLGALLFGQFDHEASLASALGVPLGRRALGTLALGRPRPGAAGRSASAARGRPPVGAVVHRGRW